MNATIEKTIHRKLAAWIACAIILSAIPGMEGYAAAAGIARTGPAAFPGVSVAASAVGAIGSGLSARGVPAVPLTLPSSLPGLGHASISLPSIPAIEQARPEWSLPQPSFAAGLPPAQAGLPSISAIPDAAAPKAAGSDLSAVSQARSAVPSSTLADKVSAVLGKVEVAWQFSFSAQPADLESAAPTASARLSEPISQDPAFQRWVKKSKHPYARLAAKLAERMSWESAQLLSKQGGIQFLPGKQGCEHACLGCLVHAGERRPIRQISWEEYTERIRALVGLQAAMKAIEGPEAKLFSPDSLIPFYDSEPMSIMFPSADGRPRTIRDMVKFLHEETGIPSYVLVTSGWNPRSKFVEPAAAAMVEDLVNGKDAYLQDGRNGPARILLQIKPVSKRFRDEARAFITPILLADKRFQAKFGKEFAKFGFDFNKYPDYKKDEANGLYRDIVKENLKAFADSSIYLADRLANVKTLAPALRRGKARLNAYVLPYQGYGEASPEVFFLGPWMERTNVSAWLGHLKERFIRTYGKDQLPPWDWYKPEWYLDSGSDTHELGTPVAMASGALDFTGGPADTLTRHQPNLARNKLAVEKLSDNPILSMGKAKALWETAAERLDGTRHLDLTDAVRRSVAVRISQVTGGRLAPRMREIGEEAILVSFKGKRPEPWVDLQGLYLFRFKDGRVYERTDLLQPSVGTAALAEAQGRAGNR
ncbi:MAG: hypothetical protein WC943_08565 [Elusimicrobiota bacterium]|jgi:hypothetical protein